MITKQKIEVGCWYIPEPKEEFVMLTLGVQVEYLEENPVLEENDEVYRLAEKQLKNDYGILEEFRIENVEKIGAPYEDFIEHQRTLESKGQQRLEYLYCQKEDTNNAKEIIGC